MQVKPGTWYVVTTDSSCTVTDSNGKVLCTAVAGTQAPFLATTMEVTLSDEGATVTKSTFNAALALLGQPSGGGNTSNLPAGYTRVDYLENTSENTRFVLSDVFYVDKFSATVLLKAAIGRQRVVQAGTSGLRRQSVEFYEQAYAICPGSPNSAMYKTGVTAKTDERASFSVDYKTRTLAINGTSYTTSKLFDIGAETTDTPLSVPYSMPLRLYSCGYVVNDSEVSLVPTVAPDGQPCLFDMTHGKPYYRKGGSSAVVGLSGTTALSNLLLQLPYKEASDAATLRVGLPSTANAAEVERLCNLAGEMKNWQITVV